MKQLDSEQQRVVVKGFCEEMGIPVYAPNYAHALIAARAKEPQ